MNNFIITQADINIAQGLPPGAYSAHISKIDGVRIDSNSGYSGNNALRDTILNYTSGQQEINVSSLTHEVIRQAQQAMQATQQGGSGSGGGTSPTNTGISTVNGGSNFQERLNYFDQAMAEQAETNLEGFFELFFTDGPMKSILENGKNSPHLSELDEEDAEKIAEIVRGSYRIARDTLYMKNSTAVTQEEYYQFVLGIGQFLTDNISFLGTLKDLLGKYNTPATKFLWNMTPRGAIGGAILGALMSALTGVWAINDFNERYPHAREDAWREVVGGTPTLLDKLNFSNRREVNGILRNIDPDRYDKANLKFISSIANDLKMGVGIFVGAILLIGGTTLSAPVIATVTGLGLLITGGISLVEAGFKADYLQKVHGHEQNAWQTVTEQLFGQDYGAFKSWFKGNENPSSSQNVAEPSFNTSLKQLKTSGLLLNAATTTTGLVFSGSAGNDTLVNIEDYYLIESGDGNDEVSNVGDRVTINAGTGNDYAANLGDNVSINGGVGNNVIDNAGSNVTMNFADGDNYVGNGGDYVTVTAGDGNNYVDNVGNFTNIRLGNGANDVENFGSNVTVNTGSGVDFIVNYGVNTTVNAGSGKNVIFNSYGSNVLINTDKDDDYISVKEGSDRVTINAGNGSDTVINNGTNDLINLEAGNDFIYNDSRGSSATISGLDGDDSLENRAAFVSINGGEGSNNFVNDGFAVTMIGGSGADTIANAGNEALINSGDGNNSIGNAGDTVSIFVGDGTDSILNEGYKVTINVAGGSNQVTNKGSETSIIVGSGSNTVQNYGEATNIKGGVDSDFIMNGATETTIDGGSGADTVLNYLAVKVGDDGNATDFHFNSNNVSIQGGLGDDYIENMGAFGTIEGGVGNDTIKNFGVLLVDQNGSIIRISPVSNYYYQIDAGEGDNFIYNENARATITSGKGYDLIENIADTVSINAGDGINTIANVGNTVTIQSGSGDDSIESDGSFVSISAGEGDDFIRNYSNGSNTTIEAGKGDDTIILDADVQNSEINYNLGDGTDIIYGCNSTTTIKIHGSSFNTNQSGNDIIVKVGDNKLILNGATSVSGLTVVREDTPEPEIISGTKGADTINNSLSDAMIFGLGGADSITNSAADVLIDGGSAGDYIYSNGKNVTIKGGTGADIIHNRGWQSNALIDGGTGGDKIYNDGYDSTIDGGYDSDYITNWADGSTLCGGEGNDTIVNLGYCQDNLLIGGTGNDFIGNGVDGKSSYGTVYNTTIDAGEGDDTIQNNGANVSINSGTGSDDIANYYRNVTINAGADNDHITNIGAVVSIDAGSGNDYIYNSGSSVTIKGGKGNDTLDAVGSEIILFGTGDGSDIINNWQNKNLISLTSGKIFNTLLSGEDIIISLGYDSLTLKNAKCKLVQIDNVDGTKTIINEERLGQTISNDLSNQTLVSGLGNDSIYNTGNNVTIQSSEGDDSITNRGANVLIEGNADSDNIENNKFIEWNYNDQWSTSSISPDNVTILGGAADDTIFNYGGQRISINASAGDDYIENKSEPYVYKPERPPSLENEDDYEEIIYPTPDRATLLGAGGNDTIINSGQHSVIDGGSGNDYISNSGSSVTIKGGTGNDTILNEGNNALFIYSGGNDLINGFNETSTLQIGNGKDTYSKEIIGADVLISVGSNVMTLKGAARLSNINILGNEKFSWSLNDTVANYGNLFTISNVKNTDSISVDNKKKIITLKAENLTGKNVSLTGDFTLKLAGDVPISTTKTPGSFTKFANGTAAFKTTSSSDYYSLKDNKITYTAPSGGKTVSIKNLNSSATLDKVKAGITVAEQKNSSLKITFKNSDVLTTKAPAISAKDVSYTVAVAKSLKPAALAPDWQVSGTNASLKSDTSAGYIVSDNKILYSKKITGSPQLVLGGLVKNSSLSAPVKKVVTLDSKVLGKNTSLKSNDGSYTVKLTGNMSKKTFTGSANADSLNIAANNATVLGGAGNDSFTVSGSKVTLTGGKGNDSFKLSGKNPMLIYNTGDGNDTVNFVSGMQISLSGSTQIKTLGKSGSDLLLGFGKNSSIKVTGAKSTDTLKVSDASGSVTLVADKFDLANSLTFNSKNSSVTVDKNFMGSLAPSDDIYLGGSKLSKVATINAANVTGEFTLTGNDKANIISAGKNNDSILGGNGNDSIAGNAGNDKLFGQNGNDSLSGGKGNDTLTGGDGKDVFIYSAGNDIIADFTAGQDKIQIASGKIFKTSLSDSDVLFTIGKGSLTVKNAKGKIISLIDSSNKASSTVVGAQTLTNSNKASVTIGADMGAVDASKRTKAISITGNALANSISGGTKNDSIFGAAGNDSILGNAGNDKLYGDAGNDILFGGKGNDSLWGGDGNDSLWGDAGKDTFIYTANEGTDKIFDYETGDLLKILNVDGSNGSFKSSKYSGGDLTLTINGGGKIIFEDVASSTKFNINGSSYNISGSKLVKK